MRIYFYGGAKSVTGANYLLDFGPSAGEKKILIDCGLFQGSRYAEVLNYEKFPYDPADIDFLLITHSHADHTGRIPKLVNEGFHGKIYCTEPTLDLMEKALPDNWALMAEEAKQERHAPLFNKEDVGKILELAEGRPYYQKIDLDDNVYAIFHNAGHILGSAIIEIGFEGKRIYFSGDLGNPPTPLLPDTDYISDADYVVIESAYGSRIHEDREERKDILKSVIKDTISRKGVLMMPSFAIERTQELLFELNELIINKEIPSVDTYMDSPLAQKITEVYEEYGSYLNEEAGQILKSGKKIFYFTGLKLTKTIEESKSINNTPNPKIIIAGSGMSIGGRILHHERRYLSDPNNSILFIGYQVEGSLGRRILEGQPEVKIFGEKVPVRCHIKAIGGYSAHADQAQLINWVKKANESRKIKRVFVVQGEEESATSLALKLRDSLAINSTVPNQGDSFEL